VRFKSKTERGKTKQRNIREFTKHKEKRKEKRSHDEES
jgi:hypothetical protein